MTVEERVASVTGIEAANNDIFNPKAAFERIGLVTDRHNLDARKNNNEYNLINLCKSFDQKIVNGRFYCDKYNANFTCYNNNGNSVIDYAVASSFLFSHIADFEVDISDKNLSDTHCPIRTLLRFPPLSLPVKSTIHYANKCDFVKPDNNQMLNAEMYR